MRARIRLDSHPVVARLVRLALAGALLIRVRGTLRIRRVLTPRHPMDRTGIHAAVDQQRLLQSDQRELFLERFRDAFDFYGLGGGLVGTRSRIGPRLWRELLEWHQVRLLLTVMHVLLRLSFRMELLLFIVLLGARELVLVVAVCDEIVLAA